MSFILDALKKSEAERQRQAGPTLLELRITRPPRRYPLWVPIVGALLVINVAVLAGLLLRRPAPTAVPAAAALAAGPPPASAATAAPVVPTAAAAAPTVAASASAAPASPAVAPLITAPAGSTDSGHNPADDLPAVPATPAHRSVADTTDYAALPNLSELGGNLPTLQLDLLDYSDRVSERYALINMHRVREGDTLPEGARVLAITRDGVALDYSGRQFMLRPGGTAQSLSP